jgi:hypothetical protein
VSADETWWEYRRISCLTLDTSNLKLPLKLALFCRGRFRGQFTITLSPPDTCGRSSLCRNWLCFARKAFGRVRTVKSGVQTFGFSCLTLDTSNLKLPLKLALFFRGLWQVELVITLFSSRSYPSFESSRNWVCLAQKPCSQQCHPRAGGETPPGVPWHGRPARDRRIGFVWRKTPCAGRRRQVCPPIRNPKSEIRNGRIGFVFSRPLPCPIRHNSLSTRHLSFLRPALKLGLFGAEWWNDRTVE